MMITQPHRNAIRHRVICRERTSTSHSELQREPKAKARKALCFEGVEISSFSIPSTLLDLLFPPDPDAAGHARNRGHEHIYSSDLSQVRDKSLPEGVGKVKARQRWAEWDG